VIIDLKEDSSYLLMIIEGRFDGLGAEKFDHVLSNTEVEGPYYIIDMARVAYISSAGIRSLVKLAKKASARQGEVLLAAMAPQVENILNISGLLVFFRTIDSVEKGLAMIKESEPAQVVNTTLQLSGCECALTFNRKAKSFLEIWNLKPDHCFKQPGPVEFMALNLEDLGLAFGLGGLGVDPASDLSSVGTFVTTGTMAVVLPADEINQPDYLFAEQPREAFIHLKEAISISGHSAGMVEALDKKPLSLEKLASELYVQLKIQAKTDNSNIPLAFIFVARSSDDNCGRYYKNLSGLLAGSFTEKDLQPGQILVGVAVYYPGGSPDENLPCHFLAKRGLKQGVPFFLGQIIVLAEKNGQPWKSLPEDVSPERLFSSHLEAPQDLLEICANLTVELEKLWFYWPSLIRKGEEKLLQIEIDGENPEPLPPEWELIVRRLYSDDKRVMLHQLKGGFSPAIPYRVTGYDQYNRRTLPTVLKMGPYAEIDREYRAYKNYVEKYILNNSTTIMGIAECGDSKGIRYNFVGISGPDSELTWLTNLYREKPAEELLPIFDKIFTSILKPWYGQPRWEPINLFEEHRPLDLFTSIHDEAEKVSGFSSDQDSLFCPYLDRELPNPYHYLKHIYRSRSSEERLWYRGINHGDLNMQNILLDEHENIYIIDFSETGFLNIVSDFARLEPIFRLEMVRLDNEKDLSDLVSFEAGLALASMIGEPPPLFYVGDDPMVFKAHRLICRLREYAAKTVIFETDLTPYLLALLQWIYPVVCYSTAGILTKKLAVYSAALLVEQIMRLESE
jgi:anti-anti-sigma factor